MNHLYLLHSDEHILLRQGFAEWLAVLGYAPVSVTAMPRHLQENRHYLSGHTMAGYRIRRSKNKYRYNWKELQNQGYADGSMNR